MSTEQRKKSNPPEPNAEELIAIVERARAALSMEDYEKLKAAMATLAFLKAELLAKRTTIERLRKLIFGAKTEKTNQVLGRKGGCRADEANGGHKAPVKRPGHGRNGAAAYVGAEKVKVAHPSMEGGDRCPKCLKGKVYRQSEPAALVRVTGVAPLSATVYECDRLRCNLCGDVFTAPSPDGVGKEKYDETATSMVGLLKYGCGLPFNRIEKLQEGLQIPLPAATQWDLVKKASAQIAPVHEELVRQAAQGDVLYNDDTTMRILELTKEQQRAAAADEETDERTGVFTSGIVATNEGHKIALFVTGGQHAGENLSDVLSNRSADLPAPIQMCDSLSRNTTGDFDTILASCNAHARRKFVEVADNFPEECEKILETFREVYKNDAFSKERKMSPDERLRFHQAESGPLLDDLGKWMDELLDGKKVEPNSGLGEAIKFMRKHWAKLTLFLRVPGAPLDNNICERALKKAILHRKNALFYKTKNGARVGDMFMSFIHTAELNRVPAFDYLVAMQRHHKHATDSPADWMPWNYRETMVRLQLTSP